MGRQLYILGTKTEAVMMTPLEPTPDVLQEMSEIGHANISVIHTAEADDELEQILGHIDMIRKAAIEVVAAEVPDALRNVMIAYTAGSNAYTQKKGYRSPRNVADTLESWNEGGSNPEMIDGYFVADGMSDMLEVIVDCRRHNKNAVRMTLEDWNCCVLSAYACGWNVSQFEHERIASEN